MQNKGFEMSWNDDDEPIDIVPGLSVLPRATFEFSETGVGEISIEVIYDSFLERLAVESVTVTASPGEEVTGAGLRSVRVQDCLRQAGLEMALVQTESGEWQEADRLLEIGRYARAAAEPDGREVLAARLYTVARLVNAPPLKETAQHLGVSQSTATRLVARARKLGLLDG